MKKNEECGYHFYQSDTPIPFPLDEDLACSLWLGEQWWVTNALY